MENCRSWVLFSLNCCRQHQILNGFQTEPREFFNFFHSFLFQTMYCSHICLRLTGISSFTCLLYLHTTDSNRLRSEHCVGERQKPPWSFEKHISTRKKTEPRKGSKREESLIRNQAQRIKERLNRDTGNWKSNIWERRRDWAFYTVNKIIWK